jgi:phosphoenolpyruvate carboxykinase (GTP)
MGSETTAAASGDLGVSRRDPMAMLPFCGYNMSHYWQHWLDMGKKLTNPPAIFHVNWFRKDSDGHFLWPGYGENVRVLQWMHGRVTGTAGSRETPIGYVPGADSLCLDGLDLAARTTQQLLYVDREDWEREWADQARFFEQFGAHLPDAVRRQHESLGQRLSVTPA